MSSSPEIFGKLAAPDRKISRGTPASTTPRPPPIPKNTRFRPETNYGLSFAGQQIPLSVLASTPNYNVFGGDISAFVNQTGELRISGGGSLDNILFSNQPIPEPSVLGLFGFGVLFLGKRLWRKVGM